MQIVESILKKRWVQHAAFWVLSLFVFWRLFGYREAGYWETDLIYIFLFHSSLLWVVYLNLQFLIPKLFQQRQYVLYTLFLLTLIVSGISLNRFLFNFLVDWIFPGYYFISYHTWWDLFLILSTYVVVSTLLKLSRSWFKVQEQERRMDELEKQNLATELHSLKAQLHPHFLFNHLNTLYSLALENNPDTPDYVVKLSDHLRYLTYGDTREWVPLETELDWLKSYLALQEIKGGKSTKIQIKGKLEGKHIPPLLLLPLAENAYKHGDLEVVPLSIQLDISDRLRFIFRNAKPKQGMAGMEGIGLTNLERRLQLLFPDQYRLDVLDEQAYFQIELEIPSHETELPDPG